MRGTPSTNPPGLDRAAWSLRGVSIGLDAGPLLRNLTFEVGPGEVVALLSSRGDDSTLLLRSALGLTTLYDGAMNVCGTPLPRMSAWEQVGFLPTEPEGLPPHPTSVGELVATGMLSAASTEAEARHLVHSALRLTHVDAFAGADVRSLPPGLQRRVLLARAVVTRPRLLLLNHPFRGLNPDDEGALDDALCQIIAAGTSVVMTVDHPGAAHGHAPRTIVLGDGTISYDGPTEHVPPPSGAMVGFGPRPTTGSSRIVGGGMPGPQPMRSQQAHRALDRERSDDDAPTGYGMGTMSHEEEPAPKRRGFGLGRLASLAGLTGLASRAERHQAEQVDEYDAEQHEDGHAQLTNSRHLPTSGIVNLHGQALQGLQTELIRRPPSGPMPQAASGPMPQAASGPMPRAASRPMPRTPSGPMPQAASGPMPRPPSGPMPQAASGPMPRTPSGPMPTGPMPTGPQMGADPRRGRPHVPPPRRGGPRPPHGPPPAGGPPPRGGEPPGWGPRHREWARGAFGPSGPEWGEPRQDDNGGWTWGDPPTRSGSALDDMVESYAPLMEHPPDVTGLQKVAWGEPDGPAPREYAKRDDEAYANTDDDGPMSQAAQRSAAARVIKVERTDVAEGQECAEDGADDETPSGIQSAVTGHFVSVPQDRRDTSQRELPDNVTFFRGPLSREQAEEVGRRESRKARRERSMAQPGLPPEQRRPRQAPGIGERAEYDAQPLQGPNPYLHGEAAALDPMALPPSLSGPIPRVTDGGEAEFVDLRPEHTERPYMPPPRPTSFTGPIPASFSGQAPLPHVGSELYDEPEDPPSGRGPALPPPRRRAQAKDERRRRH